MKKICRNFARKRQKKKKNYALSTKCSQKMEKIAFVNTNKFHENGWTYLNSWDIMRKVYGRQRENIQITVKFVNEEISDRLNNEKRGTT